MTLKQWMERFTAWHTAAQEGRLQREEALTYWSARREMMTFILRAQQLNAAPGEMARQTMRVAWALPVQLQVESGWVSAVTLDVSAGGFSTLLGEAPAVGTKLDFQLRLSRHLARVIGKASVMRVEDRKGSSRLGLRFDDLTSEDRTNVESFLLQKALVELQRA